MRITNLYRFHRNLINGKIQKMIRIKDKLLKKLKKSNDQPTRDLFKKFRNRIAIALKDSKANYYYNYFQTNSKNMKQLWSGIKSVINIRKSSNVSVISKLKILMVPSHLILL